jgi:hypothetical protein
MEIHDDQPTCKEATIGEDISRTGSEGRVEAASEKGEAPGAGMRARGTTVGACGDRLTSADKVEAGYGGLDGSAWLRRRSPYQ